MAAIQPAVDLSEDAGPGILAAEVITRVLAWIAVALRFLARRLAHSKYQWDDWLIFVAAILMIPAMAIEIHETNLALGRHLGYILATKPGVLLEYSKYVFAAQLFYAPIIGTIKLSILSLYVRLFGVRQSFAIVCYVQMGLVVVWASVTELVFLFQCSPISAAWAPGRKGGSCWECANMFIGTNTVNVIMDFAILFTPIPTIWTLQLSIQKRMSVIAILALGGGACVFSTIRLVKLSHLSFLDPTWDSGPTLVWSIIEANMGTLCACIPVMRPLLPRIWMGRSDSSKRCEGSGSSRSSRRSRLLNYIRSEKLDGSAAWHDIDEHQLGLDNPMAINRGIEIGQKVTEHSNRSETSDNKYAESWSDR